METGSDNENEIHKLNILISYPVKWTVSAIMRDYVQNFYDAVGYKDFKHQFKYKYESGVLVMMSRSSFDVDWLYYLGTSTKRNSNTATAGMFGEGFKIASLVAYRDYKYDISMESANWRIRVTEAEEMIDHKVVSCLAYEKTERIDDGLTMLCLSNVSYKDYEMLLNVIDDFFYPENPRLGPLIGGRNGYELYRSADTGNGCIFSQYQLRYILRKLPFIVSNAHYRVDRDDRDRSMFSSREAQKCTIEVVYELNAFESYDFLVLLEKYWWCSRRELLDIGEIIDILVRNVNRSTKCRERFLNEYGESLVSDFKYQVDHNRKKIARSWFASWEGKSKVKLVRRSFSKLGIIDIEDLCDREGGFVSEREPDQSETSYIIILKEIACKCFGDIISYKELPRTRIILNDSAHADGLAGAIHISQKLFNPFGIRIKYKIERIYIKACLLNSESFSSALSTYMHELLHQYGGDSDRNFHKSLMMMNMRITQILDELDYYETLWRQVEDV